MTGALLNALQQHITSIKLMPGGGGRFEVMVNGKLVYSKLETGRHTDPEEVLSLVRQELK